ncbi:allophanate hydrolase [Bermanella marisrubri]|uniref:Amidase n=1 Tax=Bermanella marisrubri TaxID=207949 RepID=Q1N577_9GAMM|nr:allophanate hydrolase [Bermanella marisrubri]EAT13201.1 Amidase [Oceanobacter sp. RED65] [Bermanella marisrubri]QIZ83971.1 allophanate hydrolase [Bermanella marisrubri]
MNTTTNMSIESLRQEYLKGQITPDALIDSILEKCEGYQDYNIWTHLLSKQEIAPYIDALKNKKPEDYPLWGIPFAIKDNIDLAGIKTTAACPEFAFLPDSSAYVVSKLIEAGAIPIGKTNLDQFATGLNGTRSPYGPVKNSFKPDYISGGSSSGSSVAVALGLVSFSLGTDTAGSGRVPACFNNLVGTKPSIGLLSATGMLPACKSLDCMTIFSLNTDDANTVLSAAEGYDETDAYSRHNVYDNKPRHYGQNAQALKIGIVAKSDLNFFGSKEYEEAYWQSIDKIASNPNIELVEVDFSPFLQAAQLLYQGPWVAERYVAIENMIQTQPDAIHPAVRKIIEPGGSLTATDCFKAQYKLAALKTICDEILNSVDCLLTPTAGRPYTIQELLEEPIQYNNELGYYTNYMNLLDYSAVAFPTTFTSSGFPFGLTLVGNAMEDRKLLSIARRFHGESKLPLGTSDVKMNYPELATVQHSHSIDVMVCGAHLDGLPLNWQLKERNAQFKKATRTAPCYRMYALAGGPPFRPGLVLDEANGTHIECEIWSVPKQEFGSFVAGIPAPLGIGKVKLEDGSVVSGFICEPYGISDAKDITEFGGWRAYMKSL